MANNIDSYNNFVERNIEDNISMKINQIKNNNTIYKEIDFKKDIDEEKSGYYYVNNKTGELQFICGNYKSLLDYGGYFIDNSEKCINLLRRKELLLETRIKNPYNVGENIFCSIFVIKHKFQNNEIICFKSKSDFLENLTHNFLNFQIGNEEALKTWNPYANGENVLLDNVKVIRFYLKKNIIIYNSMDSNLKYSSGCEDKISSDLENFYIVDLFKNKYLVNGRKLFFNPSSENSKKSFGDQLEYFYLSYFTVNNPNKKFLFKKENLIIGEKNGFLYFKTFIIPNNGKIIIKAFYKGNIEIQMYSLNLKRWVSIKNSSIIINKENLINIRLKINSLDKIKKILILKA